MANIFLVPHILLLFYLNKSAKYEKLEKYWPYCTWNRAITDAYIYIYIYIYVYTECAQISQKQDGFNVYLIICNHENNVLSESYLFTKSL